jgi:hypothetical protein
LFIGSIHEASRVLFEIRSEAVSTSRRRECRGQSFTNYEEAVRCSREGLPYDDDWQVEFDVLRSEERIFILRQGDDQARGIVARGITTSDSYEGAFHRGRTGRETFRVNIRLDSVIAHDETPVKDPYYPITGKGC